MIQNDCFFENSYLDDTLLSSEKKRVIDIISKSVSMEIMNHFDSCLNANRGSSTKALK